MRGKGICYDTGFFNRGVSTHEPFDPEVVARELRVIRDDLHCNAVQVIGGDPDRLELAARCAAELGLEVWFSPYPLDSTTSDILDLFTDCAQRAERLRKAGANVVFVTGVELCVMNHGFLPGGNLEERVGVLLSQLREGASGLVDMNARLNEFLAQAVSQVRERFSGNVTYACIPFERVDWTLFDIMSVELIRSAEVADRYQEGVRQLVAQGKPVAITGFGVATWRGAGNVAPRSMEIVEYDEAGRPVGVNGDYARDEPGQATYLRELLQIFDAEAVDSAFVYLFALYNYPHRPDNPRHDLDLASVGIVKVLEDGKGETYPDMPWEPKAAFTAIADYYGS
jgi:hypothetical protein